MAKNGKFISNSRILLKDGQTVEKGQLLTLEVGDDGKPSQSIYAGRVKAVSEGKGESDDGDTKKAKASAKEITEKAKADAKEITDKANADAKAITEAAQAKANEILAAATSGQK